MLIKAREDGGKPGTPAEAAPQSSGSGPSKLEREGQRPTQPVYQIQNRGMGASASSIVVDREFIHFTYYSMAGTVGLSPDSLPSRYLGADTICIAILQVL